MENQWILIGRDTLGLIHFDDNASFQSEGKKLFKTFIIHTRYLAADLPDSERGRACRGKRKWSV